MNDIECVLCERPCVSFGPHPICLRCTRQQAACLPEMTEHTEEKTRVVEYYQGPSTYSDG